MQDSNLRPPACKAGPGALEKVLSTYANQFLTHNKSSHGRFRGALKSLEKIHESADPAAHLRHTDLKGRGEAFPVAQNNPAGHRNLCSAS